MGLWRFVGRHCSQEKRQKEEGEEEVDEGETETMQLKSLHVAEGLHERGSYTLRREEGGLSEEVEEELEMRRT